VSVTQNTIINYWKSAGLLPSAQALRISVQSEQAMQELHELLLELSATSGVAMCGVDGCVIPGEEIIEALPHEAELEKAEETAVGVSG
jgi:uncharacterized membrane protein